MIEIIAATIVVLMIFDRFALERKDIELHGLGEADIQRSFLRVPVLYESRFSMLRGATVDYWIRDARKPTTVIEGRSSRLSNSVRGENSDWLHIPTLHMEHGAGDWILTVTVRHGDSFFNPLYRIFPVSQTVKRTYQLTITEDVANGRGKKRR